MATVDDIFERYDALMAYCAAFWKRVAAAMPGQLACRKGCSLCCELPSVNLLEARRIADYCASRAFVARTAPRSDGEGSCPFLADGACVIYEARPLICRTHGLLLRGESFRDPVTISCPYNFATVDLAAVDRSLVLDIEKISDNLARLNAAYCLTLGDIKRATERIALADLAHHLCDRGP